MKILIILILINIFFDIRPQEVCDTGIQHLAQHETNLNQDIGKQLIHASKMRDSKNFRSLLTQLVSQTKNDKKTFIKILNTRDEEGYTILLFFAVIGDLENLGISLQAIEDVLGNNAELIFEIFKQKDKKKINLLGQAVYCGDYRIIELVLSRAIDFLRSNKELFFLFINAGESNDGWRPLIDAADDSISRALEMMIKAAQLVLTKGSELYEKFINAHDQDGFTALDSAQNFRDILLLKGSGEHQTTKMSEAGKYQESTKLGRKLIDASNKSDFKTFKETLIQGIAKFKFDPDNLFNFFYARDEAGWNVVLQTAASGQYEYLQLVLKAMDENFDEHDKITKSIILANVDFEGRSPLHLAIARHHFKIAYILLRALMNNVVNKPFLLSLINTPSDISGFTPLTYLVYISTEYNIKSFTFLKVMLKELADFFNINSRMFWCIINSRDYNGWNVLAYASDHKTEKLLKSYGAVDTRMPKIIGLGKYFNHYSRLVNNHLID